MRRQRLRREAKPEQYTSTQSNRAKTASVPNASSVTLIELIENESPPSSAISRDFGSGTPWKRRNKDLKIIRMCLASAAPSPHRAGHLNSASAPTVSCQRQCEYDYTSISRSHTHRIERREFGAWSRLARGHNQ